MWIWPGNILPHSIVWSECPHRIQMLWGSLQDVYLWCHHTALSYSFRGWFEWWQVFMAIVTRFEKILRNKRNILNFFLTIISPAVWELGQWTPICKKTRMPDMSAWSTICVTWLVWTSVQWECRHFLCCKIYVASEIYYFSNCLVTSDMGFPLSTLGMEVCMNANVSVLRLSCKLFSRRAATDRRGPAGDSKLQKRTFIVGWQWKPPWILEKLVA